MCRESASRVEALAEQLKEVELLLEGGEREREAMREEGERRRERLAAMEDEVRAAGANRHTYIHTHMHIHTLLYTPTSTPTPMQAHKLTHSPTCALIQSCLHACTPAHACVKGVRARHRQSLCETPC